MAAFWRRGKEPTAPPKDRPAVCVSGEDLSTGNLNVGLTYDNSNIAMAPAMPLQDYRAILLDKQHHIYELYSLADYFVDADPIFRGIIKGVYTPFSVSEWRLVGANDRVKEKYEDYYVRVHLRDKMWSIFYQYYKYGQVFVYLKDDGDIITLPPHRCRISNVMVSGEPVVEFNAMQVAMDLGYRWNSMALKEWINDDLFEVRMKGYPPEVTTALKEGKEWVQLNPERTFVLQDIKEDWLRYAIPMIAAAQLALQKKSMISNYENSTLNMMVHSFLHVQYGDPSKNADFMPNKNELTSLNNLFKAAMSKNGTGIATTNIFAKAQFIQPDINDLFDNDLYTDVNTEILSAGGISGIIVNGLAEDGSSFASAQVSMQTAAQRIKQARDNFCELMNKINTRLNGDILPRSKDENVPKFTFPPVDLTGSGRLYETCLNLWKEGVLSTRTMMSMHGYDVDQEFERRKTEDKKGITETLAPRVEMMEEQLDTAKLTNENMENANKQNEAATSDAESEFENFVMVDDDNKKVGRPEMSYEERHSDPADAQTGRQPKPSSPEGSL